MYIFSVSTGAERGIDFDLGVTLAFVRPPWLHTLGWFVQTTIRARLTLSVICARAFCIVIGSINIGIARTHTFPTHTALRHVYSFGVTTGAEGLSVIFELEVLDGLVHVALNALTQCSYLIVLGFQGVDSVIRKFTASE